MSNNLATLAARARDAKRFRWLDGMRPLRWAPGFIDHLQPGARATGLRGWPVEPSAVPDISDPATRGCLLELVREAWGDPTVNAVAPTASHGWYVCGTAATGRPRTIGAGTTEAEALVTALEGAP